MLKHFGEAGVRCAALEAHALGRGCDATLEGGEDEGRATIKARALLAVKVLTQRKLLQVYEASGVAR